MKRLLYPFVAIILACGYLGLGYAISLGEGIRQQSGVHILMCFGGGAILLLIGLSLVVASIVLILRKNPHTAGAIGFAAIILALPPFVYRDVSSIGKKHSERRVILRIGPKSLRDAAGAVVASYSELDGRRGRFGKCISNENLPEPLRIFSNGDGVQVNSNGVVYMTDGLGSWRAGYLIVPSESRYEPQNPKKIMDGFYYVFTK